jgi:hypothetical protein
MGRTTPPLSAECVCDKAEGKEGVKGGKGDRFDPCNILESLHRKSAEAEDLRILLLLVYCSDRSSSKAVSQS